MYQAIEKEVFGYISRGDNFPWYNVYDFYPTRYVFCVPLIKAWGQKTHNELVKEKSSWSYSITNHDKSTQYTYYHGEDPILIPTPFINQKNHKTPIPLLWFSPIPCDQNLNNGYKFVSLKKSKWELITTNTCTCKLGVT